MFFIHPGLKKRSLTRSTEDTLKQWEGFCLSYRSPPSPTAPAPTWTCHFSVTMTSGYLRLSDLRLAGITLSGQECHAWWLFTFVKNCLKRSPMYRCGKSLRHCSCNCVESSLLSHPLDQGLMGLVVNAGLALNNVCYVFLNSSETSAKHVLFFISKGIFDQISVALYFIILAPEFERAFPLNTPLCITPTTILCENMKPIEHVLLHPICVLSHLMCACKHCNVKLSLYYWTH